MSRRQEPVLEDDRRQRVELLTFAKDDAPRWVGKMEMYFQLKGINDKGHFLDVILGVLQ